jgi:hypothetical protein
MAQLREQIANLADAVASGALRQSPALGQRLAQAEGELDRLAAHAFRPIAKVVDLRARLGERVRKLVETVELHINSQPDRARPAIRMICAEIPVRPHESGKFLVARLGLSEQLLAAATGFEKFVVAGAGFEPATFGL